MSEKIFIFDIDGTVIPDIISGRDDWSLSPPMQVVNEIIEEGSRLSLYPGFIDYFKSRCRHAEKVYFVTGREKEYFLGMTIFQLLPIHKIAKSIEIKFYPFGQSFDSKTYHGWKTKTIKTIIKKHKKDSVFYIYDDRIEYFENFKKKRNIILFNIIDGESFWYNFFLQKPIKVKI